MKHFHNTNRPLIILKVSALVASLYPKLTQIKQILITNIHLKLKIIFVGNIITYYNTIIMMTITIALIVIVQALHLHVFSRQPKTKCL